MSRLNSIWEFLIDNKIRFFMIVLFILVSPLYFIWTHEKNSFSVWDILVEYHGMVFDVVLFGIILSIFEARLDKRLRAKEAEQQRQERIERWKEEIDDYRGWDEKEAMYKIVGNIKRLIKEKVEKLDLHSCYLRKANLHEAHLPEVHLYLSKLTESNLWGANLENAVLTGVFLEKSVLQNANLKKALLEKAQLTNTDLKGAILMEAQLQRANLIRADLRGANLQNANILGVEIEGANFRDVDLTSAVAHPSQRQPLKLAGVKEEMLNQINWVED